MIEWYGSKEDFLSFANNPISKEAADSFNKRIDSVLRKLLERRDFPMDSFEFREVIAEYGCRNEIIPESVCRFNAIPC